MKELNRKDELKIDTSLPENIPLLFKKKANELQSLTFQASKDEKGNFINYSYADSYKSVLALAAGFKVLGISRGENVAFISDNRREWLLCDLALLSIGAVDVPRGCDSMGNEIRFIISYSECKTGIFENFAQLNKVLEKKEEVPLLERAIIFDDVNSSQILEAKSKGVQIICYKNFYERCIRIFEGNEEFFTKQIESEMEKTKGDDVATIIFTSGTTGTPKGVMLTHKNFITELSPLMNFLPYKKGSMWLSVLPVWHSFERFIQYTVFYTDSGIAYSKPVASVLLKDLANVKPAWICGVPRLWEALENGVKRAVAKKGGATKVLFDFFINVGIKWASLKDKVKGRTCRVVKTSRIKEFVQAIVPFILLLPLKLLGELLVYNNIKNKFGGKICIAISGGGALQKSTEDFFRAIGFRLLEGYGLTEASPLIAFNWYKKNRPNCVGRVMPTFEIKIVEEKNGKPAGTADLGRGVKGLILVRGPQVMKGYYKQDEITKTVIDEDGWLNTGDIGLITYDGELKITGRAKDTIVLLGGENIEPQVIESALCSSSLIESSIVLGQDKKYLSTLIVPSKDNLVKYAEEHNIDFENIEELVKLPEIEDLFSHLLDSLVNNSKDFRTCEKIYKFHLLTESFKVGEELSAKQEMMRYKIIQKYKNEIDKMYA